MNSISVWIEQLRHPLVLAGFGLLLLVMLIRAARRGAPRSDAGRLIHLLALLVMSGVVYWNKDNPGIALPVFVTLLDVAANGALAWKERKQEIGNDGKLAFNMTAAGQGQININGDLINARDVTINKTVGLSKEEYQKLLDEAAKKFAQEMQQPGLAAEERRLLEAKLQDVEAKRADLQKSYEEELARRKSAEKALDDFKGQLPDARLEEAGKSLREGDAAAAEQVFDEVADKTGKSAALANYQGGQLAEGRLDYAKAMRQYKKAAALEEDNPDYLLAAGQMARTLGDYSHAQEWLERLLQIREAEGKDTLSLARTQHDLAWCYDDQGKYAEAEPLYKRSLEIKEKSLGKDHPDVATTLNNLAGLYYKQKKYQEAAEMFERAIAIMKNKFPGGHPDIDLFQGNYEYMQAKMQER